MIETWSSWEITESAGVNPEKNYLHPSLIVLLLSSSERPAGIFLSGCKVKYGM